MPKNKALKPMAVADLEKLVEKGCGVCGCSHNHDPIFIHQICHPGAGLDVFYKKGSGVVTVSCSKCQARVAEIAVALV